MIYVQNPTVKEEEFVSLLDKTKHNCLQDIAARAVPKMEGVAFEKFVYDQMCLASKDTVFEGDIKQTGLLTFPDIIAKKYYGAEVKVTVNGKWTSTGNSILETTRDPDVQRIYLFFGRFGGTPDIRFRPYQECLYDIGVTHSPRYKIDMDLAEGKSIFDKMGLEYDLLRTQADPIKKIKEYYRQQLSEGEELWWIDPHEATVNPVIRSLNKFSEEEKDKFITEAMILFPEVFGRGRMKYERIAAYLITNYNAVASNLRDFFSSAGRKDVTVNGKSTSVSKIFYHLSKHAKSISERIETMDEEKLLYYWRVEAITGSRLEFWKNLLKINASVDTPELSALDIFNSGL